MRVVYAIYGSEKHHQDLRISISSLLKTNPGVEVECYTDRDGLERLSDLPIKTHFLDVDAKEGRLHDPNFKLNALAQAATTPYLFLDNDTYIAGSLAEPWALLERFDMMAVHAPILDQRTAPDVPPIPQSDVIPEAFPEINNGVLFINSTEKAHAVINRTRDLLDLEPTVRRDQWRMRIALYELDPKLHILPANYNFRLPTAPSVFGQIRVFHGRHPDFESLAARLNRNQTFRSFEVVHGVPREVGTGWERYFTPNGVRRAYRRIIG